MPYHLETADALGTLTALEQTINGFEQPGFKLITAAHGLVSGMPSNTLTFENVGFGNQPPPVSLVQIPASRTLPQQTADVNAQAPAGKKLISYAVVFVQGALTNVAVYR